MGLAASQARLLNLTTRMHQIEYKAAKLEAMKLQMANESTRVYEDYLEALEKTKVQIKTLNSDGSVTFVDMSSYTEFLNAGYAIDFNGTVYDGSIHYIGDNGKEYFQKKDADGNIVQDAYVDSKGNDAPAGVTISQKTFDITQLVADAFGGTTEPTGKNFETVITNLINSGMCTIVTKRPNGTFPKESQRDFADFETSVATNTGLQEISDEVELKKAEAKYEANMKRIDMKDRRFDQDLAALENERNAIKQEMETLKTVAKDNVERTFKLFS